MRVSGVWVLFLSLYLSVTHAEIAKTLGVSPADRSLYRSSGSPFACRGNPQRTIPWARVNDDYCDCPEDGSDEPGTSACIKGKFYCSNKGYRGETITASKVNDGICDCCDGSDEYTRGHCKNNCWEMGQQMRKDAEEEKKRYEEGIQLRQNLIAEAARELASKRAELDVLKGQVDAARDEANKLEESKKSIEEKEAQERVVLEEKKRQEIEAARPPSPPAADVPEEPFIPDPNTGEDAQVPAPEVVEPTDPGLPDLSPEDRAVIDEQLAPLRTEKDAAVSAWQKARDEFADIERKIKDLETLLALDFGPDNQHYYMHGKCYDYKSKEYTYQVCPYNQANQGGTSLGKWDKWESNPNGGFPTMIFDNGQQCWGGPKRSIRVSVECGSDTALYEVSEPAKCEYAAKLRSPLACSAQHLEILKANAETAGHEHDEL
eukprot:TRINITY_DN2778_c0_g1_i1.p1 TRINITY_DN2778_c0_g1~~TRINITY_DN2778_c0_g1_i1.p1  ORF type:complete len:433 (+),score=119.68 TRINITY_DN2778_c0_g1_i1:150-1448(+)